MATFLLLSIYIAFIGLGIPDSLFGTAWPAIYSEFQLPLSFASFITVITSVGTITSSMASAAMISRFGTNKVTAVSTAMTAAALFGFSVSGEFWLLCVCAIPLGLGAGSIDTALNNYVALHYSANHMSFLHCFYGIGVSVSPYILSLVINSNSGWRGGYRIAFYLQLVIAVVLFLSIPLWHKVHGKEIAQQEENIKVLSAKEIAAIPGVKLMWCLFIASCAIECTCGCWGSTFLVEHKGMAPGLAAGTVVFYYMGIALGRFLSGILSSKIDCWKIIRLGSYFLGIAIFLLLVPAGRTVTTIAMFLVGLGNGPMFPNFSYLTPHNFGKEASQSVMGTQITSANISFMTAPVLCGLLGQIFGMRIFPFYLLLFYLVMVIANRHAENILKNRFCTRDG